MKAFILLVFTLPLSASAFPNANSFSAQAIYESLNAPEYDAFPTLPGRITAKSVGGITCIKSSLPNAPIRFECGLDKADSFCALRSWGIAEAGDIRVPQCF